MQETSGQTSLPKKFTWFASIPLIRLIRAGNTRQDWNAYYLKNNIISRRKNECVRLKRFFGNKRTASGEKGQPDCPFNACVSTTDQNIPSEMHIIYVTVTPGFFNIFYFPFATLTRSRRRVRIQLCTLKN